MSGLHALALLLAVSTAYSGTKATAVKLTDVVLVVDNSGSVPSATAAAVSEFADSLGPYCRLAVVAFGLDAGVVLPWTIMSDSGRDAVSAKILAGFSFRDRYTDLNPGLGLACALLDSARPTADKVIVLLTDGRTDLPGGPRAADSATVMLRGVTMTRLRKAASRLLVLALSGANLPLLADVARGAGGRLSSAPDLGTLRDALGMISRSFVPEHSLPSTAQSPQNPLLPVLILVGLLLLVAIVALIVRRDPRPSQPTAKVGASATGISNAADELAALLDRSRESAQSIGAGIEEYGASRWEAERRARARLQDLASGLLVLLDNLELAASRDSTNPELKRMHRIALQMLDDAGIEEIKIEIGMPFVHLQHNIVERRPSSHTAGVVLSSIRRGYCYPGTSSEELEILRPADVVISSGLEHQENGS
jgi:molecular chaperone GrpE (heat shock protein)